MANVYNPNGFSPVKSLIGGGFPGQGNLYAIPSTDSTNSYAIGDVVMSAQSSDALGVPNVQKWLGATTTSALPLGIITGFATPPVGTTLQGVSLSLEKQYITANTGVTQYVYVADDPFLIFEAQFDSGDTPTTANMHQNVNVATSGQSAGTVTANQTGLATNAPFSNLTVKGAAVTATLPCRIVGVAQRQQNDIGVGVRVLCKWNYHEYGVTAGASGSVVGYLAP